LLNVISKSGTTLETIVNFHIFLDVVKRYQKEQYAQHIIVTTNEDSALWQLAQKEVFSCLPIPKLVGGRYSVFSPVGLFPLGLLGVDINVLLDGARYMLQIAIQKKIENNSVAISACIQYVHYQKGIALHDMFVFSKSLYSFGLWYRQLVAESLGKTNTVGESVGITPTVSVGSSDLHSVAQLYLGGPNNRFTTFVTVSKTKADIIIPKQLELNALTTVANKSVREVMQAIIDGTKIAYQKQKRPFQTIELSELSVFNMGQLLQWKMLEVMYLGKLLAVDPFNQPHVELYKREVKKL
jgi:glucose-6-phosphate isomerase